MNQKAKELGCTDTVFENPHGLDFDSWAAICIRLRAT